MRYPSKKLQAYWNKRLAKEGLGQLGRTDGSWTFSGPGGRSGKSGLTVVQVPDRIMADGVMVRIPFEDSLETLSPSPVAHHPTAEYWRVLSHAAHALPSNAPYRDMLLEITEQGGFTKQTWKRHRLGKRRAWTIWTRFIKATLAHAKEGS